jgi:hypothetical protein
LSLPEPSCPFHPRDPELLDLKRRLDTEGWFTSDMARRAGIDQGRSAPRSQPV